MALTLSAALFSSSLPSSPLQRAPSLVLIFLVLSVRDFLMEPARQARAHRLRPPGQAWPRLQRRLATLAAEQGLRRAPNLRVAAGEHRLYTLGTFRHSYLVVSQEIADDLERELGSLRRPVAEAALLHELQHLRQKDVIYVGLARSFLRVGVMFCAIGLVIAIGVALVSFALALTPLFTPEFQQQLEQAQPGLGQLWQALTPSDLPAKAAQPLDLGLTLLFFLNSFGPLILTVGLLSWLIWPRLLAVREFYADAGAAAAQANTQPLQAALGYYGSFVREQPPGWRWRGLPRVGLGLAGPSGSAVHPPGDAREQALRHPEQVLAAPLRHGLLAGLISTLLDTLLVGTLSVQYAAQVPGIVPVMVGFLAASFSLLPAAIQGQPFRRSLKSVIQIIGSVLVCHSGWHFLNLLALWVGVLFFPGVTALALSQYAHLLVGALNYLPGATLHPAELVGLAVNATIFWVYLGGLMTVSLAGLIWIEARLRAATLTWYALPGRERRLRTILNAVTLWTLALGIGFWLPLMGGIVPISGGFPYGFVAWVLIGFVSFGLLLAGGAWWVAHRRFSRRCPQCQTQVLGSYQLARTCPHCGQRLWPALEANY